jgi:hypothetical protein
MFIFLTRLGRLFVGTVVVIAVTAVLGFNTLTTTAVPVASHQHAGSGGGSYNVALSPAGPYTFGEQIYVTTNDPIYPNNTGPWIELKCYQNGVLVASGDHAGFSGGWYYNWPFNLGPTQSWTGGAANCTVTVFHQSNKQIVTDASTSFSVN